MTATIEQASGVLDAQAPDLSEHLRRNGPVPWRRAKGALIEDLRASGLTGRGGAGFPVWRKLATVAEGASPVVIANGAEGEPASSKDRTLLTIAPHLVLDGLQLAAEAVGAKDAYLYTAHGDSVRKALAERAARGWDWLPVTVVHTPDSFLSGQESAVVAAIEGRAARPVDRIELTARSGVKGRATLVQNVETLAHIAQIARYGPGWFRRRGTADEPGTFLATVSGAVGRPGVREAPIGTPLRRLLGEPTAELRAVLVGGYHGTWVPASALDVPMSRAALSRIGGSMGAGVLIALGADQRGLRYSAEVVTYLAGQSARQCGPCLNGLPAIAQVMTALANGGGPDLAGRAKWLANLVEGRGSCHHPDGTARFVRSALSVFGDELAWHLRGDCATAVRARSLRATHPVTEGKA